MAATPERVTQLAKLSSQVVVEPRAGMASRAERDCTGDGLGVVGTVRHREEMMPRAAGLRRGSSRFAARAPDVVLAAMFTRSVSRGQQLVATRGLRI